MNESHEVIRRRSWAVSLLHALAMLVICWCIYLAISIVFEGRAPESLRSMVVMFAEATGYFLICLLPAWATVFFRRRLAWIFWIVMVSIFSFLMIRMPH
ncbi:hypothetical protein GUL16_02885 [Stenotrophomonas maltophilia]|uniref:hypothetical protein n=1 Tax=Stenotrophomonas pavanii TaxID=487698 RepID=UPI001F3ED7B8|nr:hypothetical protein [Stenotrophomonas pavanii]MCF3482648.1 hypothetical protein [Stenotrophomonas maltophilia]